MLLTDPGVQICALGRKRGLRARGRTLSSLRAVLEDVLDNAIDRYHAFDCPHVANTAYRPWLLDHGNAKDFDLFRCSHRLSCCLLPTTVVGTVPLLASPISSRFYDGERELIDRD